MKLSRSEKIRAYAGLIYVFIVIIVVLFSMLTGHDQFIFYVFGCFFAALGITLIISGCMQLRLNHKNEQKLMWYQQYDITFGISLLSFFLPVGMFALSLYIMDIYPNRQMNYLLTVALIISIFVPVCFIALSIKNSPYSMEAMRKQEMLARRTRENNDGSKEDIAE